MYITASYEQLVATGVVPSPVRYAAFISSSAGFSIPSRQRTGSNNSGVREKLSGKTYWELAYGAVGEQPQCTRLLRGRGGARA